MDIDVVLMIAKLFAKEIENPVYGDAKNLTPSQLNLLFHNGFNLGLEAGIKVANGEKLDV